MDAQARINLISQIKRDSPGLSTVVHFLPTPMARDWKGSVERNRNSKNLPDLVAGQLSPMWTEWLMGYPIGWTESAPWAMQWFLNKQEKRLKD
jgi:hypothetical protein